MMNIQTILKKMKIKLCDQRQQGWILVDSIVGTVIVTTALVALVLMYTQASKSSSFNRIYNNAIYLAQQNLEDIKQYENTPTIKSLPSSVTTPPNATMDGVEYMVRINPLVIAAPLDNIYVYQATVSWPATNPVSSIQVVAYYQ